MDSKEGHLFSVERRKSKTSPVKMNLPMPSKTRIGFWFATRLDIKKTDVSDE